MQDTGLFVSNSASVNKAAVHKFMRKNDDGDYLFPCSVRSLQLAMREAVQEFLNEDSSDFMMRERCRGGEIDCEDLKRELILIDASRINKSGKFEKITDLSPAIGSSLNHSQF